MSKINVSSLTI